MSELSEHDKAVLNCVLYPNIPLSDSLEPVELIDDEDITHDVRLTKKMEIEAINLAECGQLEQALLILNEAIDIAPHRASIYNNRAQVYQFQKKIEEALSDLTKAIALTGNRQKRTLCQALCQRGLLHKKASRFDLAKQDFEEAARLGNNFAKSQLVELNPYAALCNQMLKQVMTNL